MPFTSGRLAAFVTVFGLAAGSWLLTAPDAQAADQTTYSCDSAKLQGGTLTASGCSATGGQVNSKGEATDTLVAYRKRADLRKRKSSGSVLCAKTVIKDRELTGTSCQLN